MFACKSWLRYSREWASQSLPKISQKLETNWANTGRRPRRRGAAGVARAEASVRAYVYSTSSSELERILSNFFKTLRKPSSEKFNMFRCEISGSSRIILDVLIFPIQSVEVPENSSKFLKFGQHLQYTSETLMKTKLQKYENDWRDLVEFLNPERCKSV